MVKYVYQHDPLRSSTPTALPPPELWYSFKAAIIRRLTSSRCYDRMLWEWILVPRALGCLPSLKVTEILPILHDGEGRGMDRASWVELMNLKVIAVWASTLPSLPLSTRSALLSRFLPGGKQRGGSWKQPNQAHGQSPHCPDSNYWSND